MSHEKEIRQSHEKEIRQILDSVDSEDPFAPGASPPPPPPPPADNPDSDPAAGDRGRAADQYEGSYPRLMTTRLSNLSPRPLDWLVPDYIPLGKLVLIAGDGGHGKTTLTLDLAACLSTGRPAFGLNYSPTLKASDVLIASCEDDFADTIVPRLLTMEANLERIHSLDGLKSRNGKPEPFSLANCPELTEHLETHPDVRLVVIDPAGAYVGTADDHRDSELRSLLGPLSTLAGKRAVTVMMVKHLNKGTTAKAVHRIGGSAGYVNAVRASFVVVADQGDANKKLFLPLKFNIARKPAGLSYVLESVPVDERGALLERFPGLDASDRSRIGGQLIRMKWEGEVSIDADTAMSDGGGDDQAGTKGCKDWLLEFMTTRPSPEGPERVPASYSYPSTEIEAAAVKAGYTVPTVRRAKTALSNEGRCRSKNEGANGWWTWVPGADGSRPPNRPEPGDGGEAVSTEPTIIPMKERST